MFFIPDIWGLSWQDPEDGGGWTAGGGATGRGRHSHGRRLTLAVSGALIPGCGPEHLPVSFLRGLVVRLALLTWWPRPSETRVPREAGGSFSPITYPRWGHLVSNPLKSQTCPDSREGNRPHLSMGGMSKSYYLKTM